MYCAVYFRENQIVRTQSVVSVYSYLHSYLHLGESYVIWDMETGEIIEEKSPFRLVMLLADKDGEPSRPCPVAGFALAVRKDLPPKYRGEEVGKRKPRGIYE